MYWNQRASKVGGRWEMIRSETLSPILSLSSGPRLLQIRDHLYQEAQSHRSEVERMRTEISDLTEELHQKEITIATITKKAALLERQLQMKLEIKEKMLGKQQVCKLNKNGHWSVGRCRD